MVDTAVCECVCVWGGGGGGGACVHGERVYMYIHDIVSPHSLY